MKQIVVYFAASSLVTLVALAPSGAGALPPLAAKALRAAADHVSPVVLARCFKWEFYGGGCDRMCSEWLPNDLSGYSYIWNRTNCSDNAFPTNQETCKSNSGKTVMSKLTSCKASEGSGSNSCIVTVCGVMNAPFAPKPGRSLRITQPTPKPKVGGPPLQGLLESDTGLVRQGPAATGKAISGSGGARAPSAGGSLR